MVGDGVKKATLKEATRITVISRVDNEYVPNVTGELIELDSKSPPIQCKLIKFELNKHWVLEYTPITRGQHRLHIKVDNEHIKGSPFSVVVTLPVNMLGTPVRTIIEVSRPSGLAINQQGEILVVEEGNECVSVLRPNGTKKIIGSPADNLLPPHTLRMAHGVAVRDNGAILVVNTREHCIATFTSEGGPYTSVGELGGGSLEFKEPMGIDIHPITKHVFITDYSNHRIQVLNQDLKFVTCYGYYGSDDGQFKNPWDVSFDSDGDVYIADSGNHRIQVFKYYPDKHKKLVFLRKFGGEGKGEGQLSWPSSICIDKIENRVYVTEDNNHRVSVFTHLGKFLTSFGEFNLPHGVAIDKNGYIYVSDHHNNRIQMF